MNTQKAAYWFGLALLAIALNSEYQRGAFPALHRVASRGGATVCRLTSEAERTLLMAKLMIGRPAPSAGELLAALDARQLADARRLAHDAAEMAREEAQDRAEIMRNQVQSRVRDQIRAQADIVRAERELQRTQIRKIRVLSQSQVRITNAVDRPVISITPSRCAQSAIRVEVPSIDLHVVDSSDDDADSQ